MQPLAEHPVSKVTGSPGARGQITVAIISDTHTRLDTRIREIVAQADIAIHAGDIGNANVLSAMRPISGRVIAVTGNNDVPVLWPYDQIDSLELIPDIAHLDLPGGSIAIEHGDLRHGNTPDHQSLSEAHPNARLVIYGHTHRLVIDDAHTPWVANPGAAGFTRTYGGPSCLLLIASPNDWKINIYRFKE